MATVLTKQRIAKGLCPRCGKEAAPYYLCDHCRGIDGISRMLKLMAKREVVTSEKRGRHTYWKIDPRYNEALDNFTWRPRMWDLKDSDRRRKPRFRGVPIEIENAVRAALTMLDRPASIEEIMEAWAKLKTSNRDGTIESNLVEIIVSKNKRAEKLARRAERAHKSECGAIAP